MRTLVTSLAVAYLAVGVWHAVDPEGLANAVSAVSPHTGPASDRSAAGGQASGGVEPSLRPAPPRGDATSGGAQTPPTPVPIPAPTPVPIPMPAPVPPRQPAPPQQPEMIDLRAAEDLLTAYFSLRADTATRVQRRGYDMVGICSEWDADRWWLPSAERPRGLKVELSHNSDALAQMEKLHAETLAIRDACSAGRLSPGEFLDQMGGDGGRSTLRAGLAALYGLAERDVKSVADALMPEFETHPALYLSRGGASIAPEIADFRITRKVCQNSNRVNPRVQGAGIWYTEFSYEYTLRGGFAYSVEGQDNYFGQDVTVTGTGSGSGDDRALVPVTLRMRDPLFIWLQSSSESVTLSPAAEIASRGYSSISC